jgi:hypothetical protein
MSDAPRLLQELRESQIRTESKVDNLIDDVGKLSRTVLGNGHAGCVQSHGATLAAHGARLKYLTYGLGVLVGSAVAAFAYLLKAFTQE